MKHAYPVGADTHYMQTYLRSRIDPPRINAIVQVFGRRRRRDYPHAQAAGVQKASMHEVAGRWAAAGQRLGGERYEVLDLGNSKSGGLETGGRIEQCGAIFAIWEFDFVGACNFK